MSNNNIEEQPKEPTEPPRKILNRFRQSTVIIALIGVAIAGIIIDVLSFNGLQGTAILYIGLPLILCFCFLNTAPSKTSTGAILKGLTIFLLLTAPFLQEGFICIIMAAPLFYIIGGIVGLTFEHDHTVCVEHQLQQPLVLGSDVSTFLQIFPFPTNSGFNSHMQHSLGKNHKSSATLC
ncbi:hypothetical protein [Leucothrix arctica]|uniref:Uncharacterized protein n=1 Tax=Leucothrix arctica TaxID=1481894 RepID=A0A317CN91_9GAMM|nr:hypothetical protein [Leucothrix arctica]PWQ97782.1 hypothetical protein DKT75_05820 [Leucothrix arctica]